MSATSNLYSTRGATPGKPLALLLSEDAWQGDAHAIIRVNGHVAFNGTVHALRGAATDRIELGTIDPTLRHAIDVEFTNDAWGGIQGADRNLFVHDILIDGASTGMAASLFSAGVASFTIPASAPAAPPPSSIDVGQGRDTVVFTLSQDAWDGDARFAILMDGQQVGGEFTAQALRSTGAAQLVTLRGDFSSAPHQVGIRFLNDAWGGGPNTDRNLYVDAVSLNGRNMGMSKPLFSAGDATFQLGGGNALQSFGTGADEVRITASQDAWRGNAVMVVTVDGNQVGPAIAVLAAHASGQTQEFALKGDFGPGAHTVAVTFTNDAYDPATGADRNLYVHSISLNGALIPASEASMLSAGTFAVAATIAPPATTTPTAPPNSTTPPTTPTPRHPTVGANADVGLIPVATPTYAATARVLTVGADKTFQTISAAINASRDGDVILVDAGTYVNDFAAVNTRISLLAVGGRVTMRADIPPPNYKGILTVGSDLRVEGFTFTGARIPDEYGHNAAGIRQEGGNLVLINTAFTGNQNGILTANVNGGPNSVTIDHCLFDGNGGDDGNGAGNIHNLYIGNADFATVTNSIFRNALVGHEYKSRAVANTLTNNLFISGVGTGTGSYNIDIPNGGKATITNNTIVKGTSAENRNMVHYGGEGIPHAGSSLTIENNLFSNAVDGAVGVLNHTSVTARLSNNVLDGLSAAAFVLGPAKMSDNAFQTGEMLPDATLVGILPGSTLIITDAENHDVLVSGGKTSAVQGGAGHVTLDVAAGRVVVIGGTGGIDLTERPGVGGSQYATAPGSSNTLRLLGGAGNTIDSQGYDIIVAGDGNHAGQLNGAATIIGGKGSSAWNINGTAAIEQNGGSTIMSVGADASLVLTGTSGFFRIDTNGGQASWNVTDEAHTLAGAITRGAATMQAYDGAVRMTTSGGSGAATVRFDKGNAEIRSLGADTIYAGSGSVIAILSGKSTVHAGTGQLAIYARSNVAGARVFGNGGHYAIGGDSGNITYHGGDKASTVDANVTNLTLLGGNGRLTVNGGARNTITGGAGGIDLHAFEGGANDITTAAGSTNLLEIAGTNQVNSWGNDTIIHRNGNTNIAVHGDSTLHLGSGVINLALAGRDTVTSTDSFCRIAVTAGADITFASNARADIQATNATVRATLAASPDSPSPVAAPASLTATGGAFNLHLHHDTGISLTTDAAAGPTSITAAGAVRITSMGADRIALADGAANLRLHGNGADIQAGSGKLDLFADWSAGAFSLHGGSGLINASLTAATMHFVGGSGGATLSGGRMDVVAGSGSLDIRDTQLTSFTGGSGTANISLNNASSVLTFGSGQTTVQQLTWGAANTYDFAHANNGREIIAGFRPGLDIATTGANVSITSQNTTPGSTNFTLSNGANVTFLGIQTPDGIFR